MGSMMSGNQADNRKGIDFSKAVSVFELNDSEDFSQKKRSKKHISLKPTEIPFGVSPLRRNKLAMKLAEQRQNQNTPPVDKFDQSLFTRGSQTVEKDSIDFDQG